MAFTNTTVLAVPMPLAPASLTHAIAFLTRPLLPLLAPPTLARLHAALRRALAAAYVPNRAARLVLAFAGPGALPPRPVHAACLAAGVPWAGWMAVLSPRAFALVIEPRVVSVAYPAANGVPAQSAVVWSETAEVPRRLAPLAPASASAPADEEETHVPISKARVQASLRATLHSALARSQTRTTLAQQLLAVEAQKEADELFAMLSTSVLSPTPTRDAFPNGISAAIASTSTMFSAIGKNEKEASPSPSSSRSSTPSSFSSAYDSDEESLTSASSVSSFDFLDSTKPTTSSSVPAITVTAPAPTRATQGVPAFARRVPAQATFVPRQVQARAISTTAAISAPIPAPAVAAAAAAPSAPSAAAAPRVFIDATRKDVTKYLYQGGVSTVLTGGVMLGGAKATPKAASAPAPRAAATTPKTRAAGAGAAPPKTAAAQPEVPKYRAPMGSGRWGAPAHRFAAAAGAGATGEAGAGAGSWRRRV